MNRPYPTARCCVALLPMMLALPAAAALHFECAGMETMHASAVSSPINFFLDVDQATGTMTNPYSLEDMLALKVDDDKYAASGFFGMGELPLYIAIDRKSGRLTVLVDRKDKPHSYPMTVYGLCKLFPKPN
ncbi:MAG TPA: hypothetical protein VGU61_18000 [Noviherbaspirillum sp.]|jgi:hypothetical protein|uniref:hypothetical protein n=1 Tax=Noviherbaspirillum sp. TaxID=1926288 RepID=UPI002DDCA1A6|nr:hypothetical protein [Noviherbaspirillum sp.]HEV2612164.1 hypothetical protein [Noviherbaspirillum sp.]